jgi:hypothetical protein
VDVPGDRRAPARLHRLGGLGHHGHRGGRAHRHRAFLTAFLVNIAKDAASPLSVAIPGELLVAMGISITSLAGTGLVLNVKRNQPSNGTPDDVKTMLEARDIPVAVGAVFSSFDGSADITSLPSIDEAFVALLGISHAGYLTTKAAS